MQKIKSALNQLWADESGQGATEYILLLVIVVAVAFMFKGKILAALEGEMAKLSEGLSTITPQ